MPLAIGTTGSPRENTAAWLAQIMLHKESAANRLPGQRSGLSSERRNSDARLCRDTQRSQNHAVYDSQRDHPTGVKSASDSLESASAEAHHGERTQLTPPRRSCCRRQAGRVAGKAKSRRRSRRFLKRISMVRFIRYIVTTCQVRIAHMKTEEACA